MNGWSIVGLSMKNDGLVFSFWESLLFGLFLLRWCFSFRFELFLNLLAPIIHFLFSLFNLVC